jgi:hypothetical protein
MNDCADSTMLRTHLDHPDAALDAHLDGCGVCTGLLHSVAEDAGYTRRTLALLDPAGDTEPGDVDVEAALAAIFAEAATAPVVPLTAARSHRLAVKGRRRVLSAAAALVVLVLAATPAGRGAVADTLDAFRGERLQAVSVDMGSWATSPGSEGMRALEDLGSVDVSDLTEPEEVDGVDEAEKVAGIAAPTLTDAPDRLVALTPGTVRLTLDARNGNGVPDDLDGAALLVDVPGAIVAVYGPADGPPELVVGRSGPLVVRAEGAPLEAVRSFLLSRDELPSDLRAQLADIDDWRSTIPVPVPVDGPGWKDVEVAGRPAIAFGDDSGIGALVLRQDPDGVTVVGGRISVSRALELAAGA